MKLALRCWGAVAQGRSKVAHFVAFNTSRCSGVGQPNLSTEPATCAEPYNGCHADVSTAVAGAQWCYSLDETQCTSGRYHQEFTYNGVTTWRACSFADGKCMGSGAIRAHTRSHLSPSARRPPVPRARRLLVGRSGRSARPPVRRRLHGFLPRHHTHPAHLEDGPPPLQTHVISTRSHMI